MKAASVDTVDIADLVLDFELYPRNDVSSVHVAALVDAALAGNPIPPIIADKKSKRVVDGFHRYRMHERLKSTAVEVAWRDYKSDAELFADAVILNSIHGRSFDPYDRRRAIHRLAGFGMNADQICVIVKMTAPHVGEILKEIVTTKDGLAVVVKGGLRGEIGDKPLTKSQEKLNYSWSGMQPAFHANQLVSLLDAGVVPKSERFIEAMDRLCVLWPKLKKKAQEAL